MSHGDSYLKRGSSAPSVVKSEFAKRVDYWEEIYGDGSASDLDANVRMAVALEAAGGGTTDDVTALDVGCGAGAYLVALSRLGIDDLVGVDITPEMIDRAKAVWARSWPDRREPEWFVADIADFPEIFADRKFDLIFCIGVIEYVPDLNIRAGRL